MTENPDFVVNRVDDHQANPLEGYLPKSGGTVTGDLAVNGTQELNGISVARRTVSATAPGSPEDGDLWVDTSAEPYRVTGGVASTSLSWDSVTNPGMFNYLMLGTQPSGPGDEYYYYVTNYCYTSSGNLTQMAIPYSGSGGIKYRTKYAGTWSAWYSA